MIDFIGDIHGHADKLKQLLTKMNYEQRNGSYFHPDRKVVFLGDYIDRGPQIRETLDIVRRMVDNGNAIALMGNHEYNAICYNIRNEKGEFLRPHTSKNTHQHEETLKQLGHGSTLYNDYIKWFLTLPLFHETSHFRAVHATWDQRHIELLNNTLKNGVLTTDLVQRSADKEDDLSILIDEVLKGRELKVPSWSFKDKDGNERSEIRVKWWINPVGMSYKELSIEPYEKLPETKVEQSEVSHWPLYQDDKPVFFGHYWMKGTPVLQDENVCCADFSVAKEGVLAAYRFDGERRLDVNKFQHV